MKVRKVNLRLSILSLSMVGVFSSMYAYADDQEAAALMNPTSSVTVEEIYVSQGSQKFGEYNGLNKQGGYINGDINVRGGDGYKKNEEGDTTRWSVTGTNLGLTNRSANVGFSDQGNWNVGVGYDQLQHNLAPGYQTPYQGGVGQNQFTLPSSFGKTSTTQSLNAAQKATFNNVDVSTTRENTSITAGKILDNGLSVNFDFNHLNQTGAKLMAFPASSMAVPTGATAATAEAVSILPNPTNYQTDTVNLALNWAGEKARLTGSYFGSFFRDGYNQVNWTTFSGANNTQTMSTAPSNQLQQLNLGGGYDFSNKTKLVGNFSFGRNVQNASSGFDGGMVWNAPNPGTPAFNGLVNTAHADIKLSDQSVKDLHLSAGYKYDSRINLSQSGIQQFYGLGLQGAMYPNTPLSITKSELELAGDYRISKDQKVRLAYVNANVNRFCNQYAVGGNVSATSGLNYPAGADCVTANYNRSNNVGATYKLKASDSVNVSLGYAVDARQTTWNQNAIAAFGYSSASTGLYSTNVNGPGMRPGQDGGDYNGFRPFFEASRNQQATKARVNWQAADDISVGLGGKYVYDVYPQSTYGVQNSTKWSLTLDTTYNYAEEGSANVYVTQQSGQRNMMNLASLASTSGSWNNNLTENDTTFGLGVKHGGLMAGKLTLNGDATYSLAQSTYNTQLNYAAGAAPCMSPSSGVCGSPGTIQNGMAALKLGASYQVDKQSKIAFRYIYQYLHSNDYYYNGLQAPYTPSSVMPTNQTTGSYAVNVFALAYTYSFD